MPFRDDLRPIEVTQPDGVSFAVDGGELRWHRWTLVPAIDPLEGLVIHDVRFDGRPVLHRGSCAEMIVPYGEPDAMHNWRTYFDAGEYGLGACMNSLELGCDCLGEIHYLDAHLADHAGRPQRIANAICVHEEDAGILWKHTDHVSGASELRRARRLVVNAMATVGNYEYAWRWQFGLDGSIDVEVQLHGIVSTMALGDDGVVAARLQRRRRRPRRAPPPAPLLLPARPRRRRAGERRARDRRGGRPARPGQPGRQRVPPARHPAARRVSRAAATPTSRPRASGPSAARRAATASARRPRTGSARATA